MRAKAIPVSDLVETLRRRIQHLEGERGPESGRVVASGCPDLDRVLPGGGFRAGTLIEWISAGDGAGAETMALRTAREACREAGTLVVLDRGPECRAGRFYPPAAARAGLDLSRLILVRARAEADYAWALDQALRCPAVAAVWAWLNRIDPHAFRRLQLAAEQGAGLGLLMRPLEAQQEPSWAEARLRVEPCPGEGRAASRRVRVCLLRCPGTSEGRCVDLEIDDETNTVCAVAQAGPARRRKRA